MFTGGRESDDEPTSTRAALEYLADDYASVSAMARDLDVPRSTLRGWLAGRTPRGGGVAGIREEALFRWRSDSLNPQRAHAMRQDWSADSLVVVAAYQYDAKAKQQEAVREVRLGEYLADIGESLVDAFLDGASPDELEGIVVDAISDHGFYAETFASGHWDVEAVNWL